MKMKEVGVGSGFEKEVGSRRELNCCAAEVGT